MRLETTGGRRADLTTVAGWMAVTLGAVHVVVVPLRRRANLSQLWADGWWNAFTLEEPTTLAEAERALTFWQTLGSFGYPMLALVVISCGRPTGVGGYPDGSAGSS